MKKIFLLLLSVILLTTNYAFAATYVKSYFKKDGTYVQGHYRSDPNSNPYDNWSYPGNTNPYTGKTATGDSTTYLNNYYNNSSSYTPSNYYTNPIYSSGYVGSPYSSSYTSCSSYGVMAVEDTITGKCKCMSGYVFGKGVLGDTQCVSASSYCSDNFGYNSRYNSLNNSCECSYGYEFGNGGKCVDKDTLCKENHGIGARFSYSSEKCECSYGYEVSNNKCALKTSSTPSAGYYTGATQTTSTCPVNSYASGTDCYCNTGFKAVGSSCVAESQLNFNQANTCPLNSEIRNGKCECKTGYEYSGTGCKEKDAYIAGVTTSTSSNIEKQTSSTTSKIFTMTGGEQIRECAQKTCKVTYKSKSGDVATVLFKSGDWSAVQIKAQNGLKTGYMHNSILN